MRDCGDYEDYEEMVSGTVFLEGRQCSSTFRLLAPGARLIHLGDYARARPYADHFRRLPILIPIGGVRRQARVITLAA
jgi:hypothetical protein